MIRTNYILPFRQKSGMISGRKYAVIGANIWKKKDIVIPAVNERER